MPRRRKRTKETSYTKENVEEDARDEELDSNPCEKPEKLDVPCARVKSDGEWFPINRVLDTVSVVGSNKTWRSLVQWKPSWSSKVHTSALKDFHGRATVLGCVVKNDVLRSRVYRKIDWDRKEFMCMNFRVRIENPDGSWTHEVIPYPDVKRRFPAALFDYFENRMPPPRLPAMDEPRRDGLLSIYNSITLPRCLYLNNGVQKKSPVEEISTACSITNGNTDDTDDSICVAGRAYRSISKTKTSCRPRSNTKTSYRTRSDTVTAVVYNTRSTLSALRENYKDSTGISSNTIINKSPQWKCGSKRTRREIHDLQNLLSP